MTYKLYQLLRHNKHYPPDGESDVYIKDKLKTCYHNIKLTYPVLQRRHGNVIMGCQTRHRICMTTARLMTLWNVWVPVKHQQTGYQQNGEKTCCQDQPPYVGSFQKHLCTVPVYPPAKGKDEAEPPANGSRKIQGIDVQLENVLKCCIWNQASLRKSK